jgi:uncharacterized protein (DUF4415 family)
MSGEDHPRIVRAKLENGKAMIQQLDGTFREAEAKTDWERVNAMTNVEVEAAAQADTAAPPPDEEFWRTARVVMPEPRIAKRHQGMRLDAEIIDWFKAQGPGWQTRMNAVLKSFVEAQKRHGPG